MKKKEYKLKVWDTLIESSNPVLEFNMFKDLGYYVRLYSRIVSDDPVLRSLWHLEVEKNCPPCVIEETERENCPFYMPSKSLPLQKNALRVEIIIPRGTCGWVCNLSAGFTRCLYR